MANSKNVSRLTKEELARASASLFGIPQKKSVPVSADGKPKQRSFLSKLSNKEIVAFFTDFTNVVCENFEVIFNDFDFAVICNPKEGATGSTFDYPAFVTYCDSIDKAPEEAIADIITSDLLTPRFPSYAEKRRKHKDEQARNAYAALPKSMRIKLKSLNELVVAKNALMENKGKYGAFDAEDYLKTTYGEGQ